MEKEFLELFDEVFAANGTIRMCGRDKYEDLIELADKLEPETHHGNTNTGFINAKNMRALKEKLENPV